MLSLFDLQITHAECFNDVSSYCQVIYRDFSHHRNGRKAPGVLGVEVNWWCLRCDVTTPAYLTIQVFWPMTILCQISFYRRFEGASRLHLQGFEVLKMPTPPLYFVVSFATGTHCMQEQTS